MLYIIYQGFIFSPSMHTCSTRKLTWHFILLSILEYIKMDAITDPRIKEIMAKLNQEEAPAEEKREEEDEKKATVPKPPTTFEEFLKVEKLVGFHCNCYNYNYMYICFFQHYINVIN